VFFLLIFFFDKSSVTQLCSCLWTIAFKTRVVPDCLGGENFKLLKKENKESQMMKIKRLMMKIQRKIAKKRSKLDIAAKKNNGEVRKKKWGMGGG
jgi:hypothetical protein